MLEAERGETKNEAKLDELIGYLQARQAWMVNYRQRRIERRYIGSAQVEKANDLLVARRQKNRGMQWSEATSDALAALRTLLLNGGWDRYWHQQDVLPNSGELTRRLFALTKMVDIVRRLEQCAYWKFYKWRSSIRY